MVFVCLSVCLCVCSFCLLSFCFLSFWPEMFRNIISPKSCLKIGTRLLSRLFFVCLCVCLFDCLSVFLPVFPSVFLGVFLSGQKCSATLSHRKAAGRLEQDSRQGLFELVSVCLCVCSFCMFLLSVFLPEILQHYVFS